ncbi:MAG TPA: biotin synthase BioB [bacterium]|nr:biotin synthase BioB [bacterium]
MDITKTITAIAQSVSPDHGIGEELALALADLPDADVPMLFPVTRSLRAALSGNRVYLCSIINAKSGRCSEDCRFCAQSAHWRTDAPAYPLRSRDEIVAAARAAKEFRAREFSIVTSGKGINEEREVIEIAAAIAGISELGMRPCVSPGIVEQETLTRWKAAGLAHFHHNLETAPSFFKSVCTTHRIEEDVAVVKAAKAAGLSVCCGGIFGLGESWPQRVELALLLRELEVDSAPVNFLNPIPGTPLADSAPGITPLDALKTIALMRLAMPRVKIVVCGGRHVNLRDLQSFMFEAGANALMVGDYLTTRNRPVSDDLGMIADLGLEPAPP